MENYRAVLENVARKELTYLVLWAVVLVLVISFIWAYPYFHFSRTKKMHSKSRYFKKQAKQRRESILAAVALSGICVLLGALLGASTIDTYVKINKDIEENAYVTYTGDYYVDSMRGNFSSTLFDSWILIDFTDGEFAFLYMDNPLAWMVMEEGDRHGTIIYGKNSLIVVEIVE